MPNFLVKKNPATSNLLKNKGFYILIILAVVMVRFSTDNNVFYFLTGAFFLGFYIITSKIKDENENNSINIRVPFVPFLFISLFVNTISGDALQLVFKYL